MHKKIQTVKTLLEALPFIEAFHGKTVVIKFGGAAQISPQLKETFARDIALLSLVGVRPVIVHGGGKEITSMLDRLGVHSEFVDGHRVTSEEAMRTVEMVLFGQINSEIVALLNNFGVRAVGLSGKSAGFVTGEAKDGGKFGYTGEVKNVSPEIIYKLQEEGLIPVIAPIASGENVAHPGYNINADTLACAVAASIEANKVIFMTDTSGVLNANKELLSTLTAEDIARLKKEGVIAGGMIPKVDACLAAINGGVKKAHIIDGRVEHSILLELFTEYGVGTQILEKNEA